MLIKSKPRWYVSVQSETCSQRKQKKGDKHRVLFFSGSEWAFGGMNGLCTVRAVIGVATRLKSLSFISVTGHCWKMSLKKSSIYLCKRVLKQGLTSSTAHRFILNKNNKIIKNNLYTPTKCKCFKAVNVEGHLTLLLKMCIIIVIFSI